MLSPAVDSQGQPEIPDQSRDGAAGSTSAVVALAALGVVYGDIGTSPLYAIRECFHGEYGIQRRQATFSASSR